MPAVARCERVGYSSPATGSSRPPTRTRTNTLAYETGDSAGASGIRRPGTAIALACASAFAFAQTPPAPVPAPGAGDALRDAGDKAREIPQPRGAPTIDVAPEPRRAVK